ncbi:hypothetical protein GYMLUDRAFT_120043, partial [Collybiopsis luxurians FD-317 M1]
MNSVNASTGLSMFQLKMGRSPRILPPLTSDTSSANNDKDAITFTQKMHLIETEVKDGLIAAKVQQAFQSNKHRGCCEKFEVSNWIMLLTLHRREGYKKAGEKRVTK